MAANVITFLKGLEGRPIIVSIVIIKEFQHYVQIVKCNSTVIYLRLIVNFDFNIKILFKVASSIIQLLSV